MADIQNGNAGDRARERVQASHLLAIRRWPGRRGGCSKEIANVWSPELDLALRYIVRGFRNAFWECYFQMPSRGLGSSVLHTPPPCGSANTRLLSRLTDPVWPLETLVFSPRKWDGAFLHLPPLHHSSLLTSVIDSKDYLPRWTLSSSNNKNVRSSLGVTSLFRNKKITVNTLVPPTREKMGNLLKHPPPQTEIHKNSGKAHFVTLTLIYII